MKYQIMFYGGVVGTIIMIISTIRIFIKYEIIQVIKDLLGIAPRKKKEDSKEKVKGYTSSVRKNTTRDNKVKKLLEGIEAKDTDCIDDVAISNETEIIEESSSKETEIINENLSEETEIIESECSDETSLLEGEYTTEDIYSYDNETMFLQEEEIEDETTLLTESMECKDKNIFIKEVDVMVVNCERKI